MKIISTVIAFHVALLAGAACAAVIENDALKVVFREADAAFDVTDKASGRVWRMMEGEGTALETSDVKVSGAEVSFAARSRAPALDMRMRLALEGRELSVSISAPADAKIAETRFDWPYPFAGERGDRVLLTQGNGFAFPVEMTDLGTDKIDLSNYPGRDMEMGCWGQYAETVARDGEILPAAGCLAIIETPENSGIRYTVRRNGFRQANVSWLHDRLAFGHDRRIRFVFGKTFGPIEMALRYREEMKRKGYWVPFAEKRRRYPQLAEKIDLLVGAPNVWYWADGGDKAGVVRRLKELGFENVLMQFATRRDLGSWVTPEEIRAVAAVPGVLAGEYDIYKDFMDPANLPLIDCPRPYWPTNVWENGDYVIRSNGTVARGWGVDRKDGKGRIGCASLCEAKAWSYARDRIGRAIAQAPHASRLLDVTGGGLSECWNPAHPLGRRQSRKVRTTLFDNIQREFGILVGTEDGGEWCVPVCCYFEGTMSAPNHYRVDGGRYMWKVYDDVPDNVRRGLDETMRVPFFEMVFHGCVVTYWYWCDYNNKFMPLWRKHDLFNALYGTPPMYLFTPETFAKIQDRLAESRVTATATAKAAGLSPMCAYRWLTPDRKVQQSRFENGVVCTVNFGEKPYKMDDGSILPPNGFKILTPGGAVAAQLHGEQDYLRRKFREDVTDRTTGIGLDALKNEANRIVAAEKDRLPWCIVKAHLFEMICDRMSVGFSPYDFFPAFACWSRKDRILTKTINDRIVEVDARHCPDARKRAAAVKGSCLRHDYDHAVPDWDRALAIGFPGIKAEIEASPATNDFRRAMAIAADAMLRNVRRFADCARRSKSAGDPRIRDEIATLDQLAKGPPRTAYEAMMFQLLFFIYGEHVDHLQVRSLGNWDRLMLPYYEADIAAGRTTRERFKEHVKHFWWQWGSIDNWWGQPVYIGGTKADGTTEYNEVSRIVLEVTDELALPTPKLQLKIAKNTPEDVFVRALDMARRHRSVVFCGEEPIAKSMAAMGFTAEEARTCDIWGCYEFQPRAAANTTLPCVINMPHIVADLLDDAKAGELSAPTFEDFVSAFHALVRKRVAVALDVVRDYEAHMDDYIPALVHSLSIASCVAEGKNAIGNGMEHNLSVILQTGAGTAVDSLSAVKEIVYERREMSLAELGRVMAENWKGHEELRLRMCASRRKWGNNDLFTNRLTHDLYHVFGEAVNGKANSRDGRFFAAGHSIDFFTILGRKTGATPDGRRRGDEFSKNISPAPGADREGPTALVAGISSIDCRDIPADIILDTTIHPSLVHGEKGLAAMKALVERYFAVGGTAIHFNVFSAEELRDAQLHPERYENLQVRVCGWNVRWNDLSRKEQDAYIRRAEGVMNGR